MDKSLWLIEPAKLRDQWAAFKPVFLSQRRGMTYREIKGALVALAGEAEKISEIDKLTDVAILLPLANAVSEFGFSLQNITKTAIRNRIDVNTTLDASMRVSSIGPTDPAEISALVDRAVPLVFATARPNKAVGAAGSAVARRENGKKRKSAEPSASSAIAGASNKRVAGDGTAASAGTVVAPFPSDVYEVDLEMPVRDDTLIGKQILHVADLGKGSGLEFVQFTVAAGKQKHHNDASGVPRPGSWKFKLVSSLKRTELKKVSLRSSAYGIKGMWYLAQKKPVKKKKKAAEGKKGGK
jgi:hypothetical protein